MRYLTFALTKGRLANKTLDMFEKIGITCEEMRDKDSRKLIFTNEELKLKFFLAKGPDVPTYVEYGAADIGIVSISQTNPTGKKGWRCFRKYPLPLRRWRWTTNAAPLRWHTLTRTVSFTPFCIRCSRWRCDAFLTCIPPFMLPCPPAENETV